MRWTWDPKKAEANRAKHGVSFETAKAVFDDPLHLSQPDPHSDGDRWKLSAWSDPCCCLSHTWPEGDEDPVGRIVSARKATAHERKAYEEEGP